MSIASNDELLAALLAQHRPRGPGCRARIANAIGWVLAVGMFVTVMAKVLPGVLVDYGVTTPEQLVKVLHMDVATPAPQILPIGENGNHGSQTPAALPPRQQQPVVAPGEFPHLPDCATVQDTTTACVQNQGSDTMSLPPTPTAAPTPTATGFWTAEEQAQFAATAEAFYTDIPTPEPTFAAYVNEACQDEAKVAQSKLLASWCGDE